MARPRTVRVASGAREGEAADCQLLVISCHTADMDPLLLAPMPNTYVRLMAQASRDPARMLDGSGLDLRAVMETDDPISVRQSLICSRNAVAMMARPDWHFAWAETIGDHFHGPLTTAWLSAPTLGDGIDVFIRYMPARIPYLAWRGRQAGRHFWIELTPLIDLGEIAAVLVEIPLLALLGYLRTVRGGRVSGATLQFMHAPVVPSERYEARCRCAFRFGQRRHALIVPAEWRALANAGHDPLLWRTALQRCESDLRRSGEATLAGTLRQYLLRSFDGGSAGRIPPTVESAAVELHMSVRTLHRRLRAAGVSYQALVDDARRERAAVLMLDARLRLGDVAAMLGYSDPANFSRAYRRWYGRNPRDARREG